MRSKWIVFWALGAVVLSSCSKTVESPPGTLPEADTPPSTRSYMYVANKSDRSISVYSIEAADAEPVVTLVDTVIPDVTMKPEMLRTNSAGTLLYVSENGDGGNSSSIRIMSIDSATGVPTTTATLALSRTTYFTKGFALDRTGGFLFASHYIPSTDTLLVPFSLGSTGILPLEGTALDLTAEMMQAPEAHPTLDRIYSASIGTNQVFSLSYDSSSGALTQEQAVSSGGSQPRGVSVHPSGDFLIAYHGAASSVLSLFPIDESGDLGTASTVTQSRALSNLHFYYGFKFHPTLNVAYGVSFGPEKIAAFTVDTDTPALTELGDAISTGATGDNPIDLAIEPQGKFAFVANQGGDEIYIFKIDSTTGALEAAATSAIAAGDGPQSVQIVSAP